MTTHENAASADRTDADVAGDLVVEWVALPALGAAGSVIVTGVFDLLHVGHLRFLRFAAERGRLVVGVEDDERTRAAKGARRPITPEGERAEMLAALRPVDGVFLVHGDPGSRSGARYERLLRPLRPSALAWSEGDSFGDRKSAVARALGVPGLVAPVLERHSTTRVVDELLDR